MPEEIDICLDRQRSVYYTHKIVLDAFVIGNKLRDGDFQGKNSEV